MSEKSPRGAGPGVDQAPEPAAPSGGRSSDSGAAPVEPWAGDRTDRVSGRETSGARVALVPSEPPDAGKNDSAIEGDGKIQVPASMADTRRVDSGRTTLMGVPSPMVDREKPTSPGHDVHLPSDKARAAGARPVAPEGSIAEVEPASSSTQRLGSLDHPGPSPAEKAPQATTASGDEREDSKGVAVVPNERSLAAAAATFRGSGQGSEKPRPGDEDGEPERERGGWTADRTEEFNLQAEPQRHAFAKTLSLGMALAVGLGVLVQSFIHSRVRGSAPAAVEVMRPPSPPPAPLPLLPENPVPPPAIAPPEPTAALAQPGLAPSSPEGRASPEPEQPGPAAAEASDTTEEAVQAERRPPPRTKALAPAGRPAASARTTRATTPVPRPGLVPEPEVAPAPAAATAPPPLNGPPPEKPARPAPPKQEPGTKPYDPDMPLPPSME